MLHVTITSPSLESPLPLATPPHFSPTSASCPCLFIRTSSSSTHAPFHFQLSDIRPIVKKLFLHPVPSPHTSAPHLLHLYCSSILRMPFNWDAAAERNLLIAAIST